ncbi:MAG TPA: hypothetical protein VHM01_14570 [Alphaproteobacteria bacterium]|nr:hypothetical protein [Alphaproteobacteria bacterium]
MPLRFATATVVACLFLIAGWAIAQTPPPAIPPADRAVGDPVPSRDLDGTRTRLRYGTDSDSASGTFGATGRGAAAGAADSAPAEGRRSPGGEETMSEPTGPGSAERRPGTAVGQ